MNPRERALAVLLIALIILGAGGFVGYQFIYTPWSKSRKELDNLRNEEKKKQARQQEIEEKMGELDRARVLSLPGDQDTARLQYERYLNGLFSRNNVAAGRYSITPRPVDNKSTPTTSDKTPIYTRLTYNVQAYATMDSLVKVMKEFYDTGLMHQIKNLSIQRQLTNNNQSTANELDVRMTIEALIVTGADKRPYLLPNIDRRLVAIDLAAALQRGPTGLGLVLWAAGPSGRVGPRLLAASDPPRNYDAIVKKNVFLGRAPTTSEGDSPEWMAPRFVHLTRMTSDSRRTESFLFDVLHNRRFRLRETEGFNTFPFIKDNTGTTIVHGAIVQFEDRDIIYRAEMVPGDGSGGKGFSRPDKAEREQLVSDGTISSADAQRVLRTTPAYWDHLVNQLVIHMTDKDDFRIELEREKDKPAEDPEQSSTVEVLRGKVVHRDKGDVFIVVEPRYYTMHMGQSVEDSLKKPLPREKLKELKLAGN
jgi:hypothetical protein